MLGFNGVVHAVYSNPFPTKVEISITKPYRSEPGEDGHYTSNFCDSCRKEFEQGEEGVEIHVEREDWEQESIYTDFLVCMDCYKKPLEEDK
jgi:hypothetical protein